MTQSLLNITPPTTSMVILAQAGGLDPDASTPPTAQTSTTTEAPTEPIDGLSAGLSEPLSNLLLGVAGAMILLGIFFSLRKLRSRRAASHERGSAVESAREEINDYQQARGLRRDLESLVVQVEEVARQLGAQLDNKITRAEATLDECDRKIKRLKELQRELDGRIASTTADAPPVPTPTVTAAATATATEMAPPSATISPTPDPGPTASNGVYSAALAAHDASHRAHREREAVVGHQPRVVHEVVWPHPAEYDGLDEPAEDAGPSAGNAAAARNVADRVAGLRERVYVLADAGHDAGQIARALDEQRGKVELILSARR